VPWEEAAAFPVPALTAAQALLEVIAPDADGQVLVNGAGGVTGGLTAALAWLWGARVIASAGPASAERLGSVWRLCTTTAIVTGRRRACQDEWHRGPAAVNAASGGEAATLSAVAGGGRFATITGAPPKPERGVSIANIYVRADGRQLRELAGLLAKRELEVSIDSVHPLARAADALALVTLAALAARSCCARSEPPLPLSTSIWFGVGRAGVVQLKPSLAPRHGRAQMRVSTPRVATCLLLAPIARPGAGERPGRRHECMRRQTGRPGGSLGREWAGRAAAVA
jgi:Zinc-binding dehydrogenase